MARVNGLNISRIPINGKETIRVMRNGVELWSGTGLPSGYTLLEYIQSSGNSYIDTGYIPTSNILSVEFKTQYTGSASSTSLVTYCGFMKSSSSVTPRFGVHNYEAKYMYGINSTNTTTTSVDNDIHVFRYEGTSSGQTLYLDGTSIGTSSTTSALSANTLSMYLMARNVAGSATNYMTAKMYYCQIYDNGTLVRDYIPCMNASNVCGLFDKVNKVFYPSASSTAFSGDYFEEVEYIQSSGSQYIDTGFKPNQDTRVVMDVHTFSYDTSVGGFPFGVRADNASKAFAAAFDTDEGIFYNYASKYTSQSYDNVYQRMVIDANKNVCTFTGSTSSSITMTYSSFSSSYNLVLCALSIKGSILSGTYLSGRVYSCKIYDNGTLVRDFVPVKGMVTGTYGLYDKLNGVFYPSATTTGFTGA